MGAADTPELARRLGTGDAVVLGLGAMRLGSRVPRRRRPRAINIVGVMGCLTLLLALPPSSVAAGAAVLAVGLLRRRLLGAASLPTRDP
jgi:hypothetical protein